MKNRPFRERLGFALSGIAEGWRNESSLRMQALAAACVVLVLLWLQPAPLWWAIILLSVGLVLAAELFNTALERVVDHLHPERHPMIKAAKDCAAGAVLLLSLAAVAVIVAMLVAVWRD